MKIEGQNDLVNEPCCHREERTWSIEEKQIVKALNQSTITNHINQSTKLQSKTTQMRIYPESLETFCLCQDRTQYTVNQLVTITRASVIYVLKARKQIQKGEDTFSRSSSKHRSRAQA